MIVKISIGPGKKLYSNDYTTHSDPTYSQSANSEGGGGGLPA